MEIVQGILLVVIAVYLGLIYDELQKMDLVLRQSAGKPLDAKDERKNLLEYAKRGLPLHSGAPISLPVRMTPSEFAEASRAANIKQRREEMQKEEARKNAS